MNKNVKLLAGSLQVFIATLLFASAANATPDLLDWDTQTWTPAGNTNLSETFNIGSGDIIVTFGGNTAGLEQAGADVAPSINQVNTGGLIPAQDGLYVGTDYVDNSNPMVTITFDFMGYPGGVGNFSFDVFDNDLGTTFIDEMTVTAMTASGAINPTSVITSVSNTQTNVNTVRGTAGSGATSSDANITWVFGDAGTPVSGITQITIVWRNLIGTANPGLQWINIGDFSFDDPMADVELTKGVSPTSAGAGESVVFTLDAVNNGPDDAPGVQVTDQLPAGFTWLSDNGGGDYVPGTGVWTVGTLAPSGTAQLQITARMEGSGPWDNSAEVTQILAEDPDSTPGNNIPAEDDQDNAAVTLLVPEIGTAKAITAGPTNNGDGTYTLTYTTTVVNSGDTILNSLQVVDNLAATFAGTTGFVVDTLTSADFTVNAGFNGAGDTAMLAGTDSLALASSGTIALTVTLTPGAALGPFDNTATADALSPGAVAVSDDSTDGANPDPDTDGDPGNNSVPTSFSVTESPEIGVAKRVISTPVNNGDGTRTLTYEINVVNSGDVPLNNVQLVDDMAATFAAADGVVVDSVVSGDFTVNGSYDGNGNNNVLAGTDTLATAASGTVSITVTVTVSATLGTFQNTATGSGTSPGGMGVNDVSQTGTNPDPDSDGNPGNNSVPTPISFTEDPQIGLAKAVSAGPTNNGDGTHTLTYRFNVGNYGDGVLNNVQVVDNLSSTFSGATGFVVDSLTSADFAVNTGFNGVGDTNILAGTDTLAIGAAGAVDVTVTVTPGGNLGPYDNSAFARGQSPTGALTIDNSVDGLDPDPDANGDPVDNVSPTPVTLGENPVIGTAKSISAGPTNNGDGSYTLTYRVAIENSGDVVLNSVQLVDNLATTFASATGFVVDSVASGDFAVNAGFNGAGDTNVLAGTDTLAVAASGTVDVTVTVTPGATLGPYNNTATADGTSPGGMGVSDDSNTGVDPDPDTDGDPTNNSIPTPVTFGENPEIGTAKSISTGPTNNGDGTYTLTYRVTVENSGDVPLNGVQVVDSLATTFAGATGFVVDSVTSGDFAVNAGFNGAGDTNVLAGTDTLAVAASGTVDVTVTVTPGATLGPYNNTATADGTSPGGMGVSDDSNTGVDPDPDTDGDPTNNSIPTPVTFGENPEIGTAKTISTGPTNNGDGSYTLTYRVTVENSGDVPLNGVQVVDSLATTFAGATGFVVDSVASGDFAVNAGFNGAGDTNVLAGTDTLAVAATGTVDVTVTVTPGATLGPYNNTATADGTSPGGMGVSDDSNTGVDPDPDTDGDPTNNSIPTPVTFSENPEIGTAKTISTGPTNNGDGSYTLTYRVTVENSGDVPLNGVQVVDSLATTFAGATGFVVDSVASGDFAVNAGFNGAGDTNVLAGTDTLAVAASGTVDVTLTVTPGATLGPYNNTATADGTSPGGMGVSDDSNTGVDPDPDTDGDPTNNSIPTPVTFGENPEIGTAKSVNSPTNNGDGTFTLTYTVLVNNSGDVNLSSVQVVDDLGATFAAATGFVVDSVTSGDFAVNAGFNGAGDTNLLAGTDTLAVAATGTVDVVVTVTPGATLGPYNNTATANGTSPIGTGVSDVSTTGANPDPDTDGDPTNNSTPTPVSFNESPQIGIAKAITVGPTNNGDGTHTLSYTFTLENFGDVSLSSVQAIDNLATTFSAATGFVVDSVTSADFTVNPGYNGNADTNLLAGTDTLAVAASGTLVATVTVTPGGTLGPYDNSVTAQGTSPGGSVTVDNSVDGLDPDPDGNDDPVDNVSPTPVTFGENPEIGTAKSISIGPTNNGDGTYTLTYRVTIENSGDVVLNSVQLVDNLATTFAGATGFVVDSVTSGDFAVNAGFNGAGDTNVLAGTDTMAIAASGTVDFTVTVTPGATLGPYNNTATANGTSPGGMGVSDDSNTGVDPDPDTDGDPTNNSIPTPVTFGENPEIGTAKSANAPTNNGDGTFTLTYTVLVNNSGDVNLSNVQVVDDLAATFAAATGFVVDSVTSGDFTVNAGYNGVADTNLLAGTDTLAVSASGSIAIQLTVTPGAVLGPYNNTATANGTSPVGTGVSDVSTTGADPDPDTDGDPTNNSTPTPVSFNESPQIGVAKAITAGPTNNGDGTHTLSYTFTLENFGDVALSAVQATDNLATTFSAATGFVVDSVTSADFTVNPGYNGNADTNLLAGTDTLAVAASGTLVATVTVTPGATLGPYENSVTAQGTSPGGSVTVDNSVDGLDPDPDGNDDPVDNVSPTPVTFGENPQIGIAKTISTSQINNGDGSFTLTYTMTVENSGDVTLSNVQVVDDLAATFAGATSFVVDAVTSGDFAVNAGFNGAGDTSMLAGTDTLAVAASGTVDVTVTVTPGATLGPYNNTATANGTSPGSTSVNDVSTDGVDPDPDTDGDPSNNSTPTPVTFGENPEIGIAKTVSNGPINNGDGTFTLTYTMTIANPGDVALSNVQVVDSLATTFTGATGFVVDSVSSGDFAVNAGFNGAGDSNILAGTDTLAVAASGTVDVIVTVTPGGSPGPYNNTATANGASPSGVGVSDVSTDGVNPDPDTDGDPGNNSDPTPVSFMADAALSGNAWLDQNIDNLFDADEMPLEGWIVEVLQGGVVVATVPVNPDGSYNVSGLPPGGDYSIRLRNPASTAVFGQIDGIVLPPGLTVIDQNLPIDPSGVVYDSSTRMPVGGVTVTLVDSNGIPLPASCLLPSQQNQITGADGYYRFDLVLGGDPACSSGDVFDIVFVNPAGYVPGVSTQILPTTGPLSATGLPDPFQVQPQAGAPMGGASTLYYLSFMLNSGDPNIINNHIPIDPIAPAANLLVSKRADRRQTVVGDLILYTVRVSNPGGAISGLTLSDLIPAGFTYVTGSARQQPGGPVVATGQRPVEFTGINVAANSSTEVKYMLRVGAGVVQGDYINTVTPLSGGVPVGNTATATVTVTADPDFEQTSVVGMVFNDTNGDGWQDEGEHGIPGVRLATVEGLIIETDAFGRYHIAGIDGGRRDRGRNFIIKVDANSLPEGVEFTTENPRVQRITEGLLNRFDFGVNMPTAACCEQIDVKIGEVFFEQGSSAIRPEFMPLMQQLADRLRESSGGTLYIQGNAEPSEAVAYTPAAYTVTQYFDPRSARLSAADKAELDRIIERWRGVDNISVSAVGHTCNTRIAPKNRHEFKDNYALSIARAQAVAAYVRLGLGIAPEQVSVAGKGPDQPVASNATPEGGALNRRVELSISGQRSQRASTAADLARDRANSIYQALEKLLGDELIRNINISGVNDAETLPQATPQQESEMTSQTNAGWLSRSMAALLGVIVSTANADGLPASCTVDSCLTDNGYAIQILPSSSAPSPNDTRAALADDKRVDISGRFSVPVAGGGQLWATEDPAGTAPRLAAHGPRVTPVANGKLAMPVSFYIYANYPAFIDKAQILIYHGGDIDLIDPIAVVPFKAGVYSRIDWNGADLTRQLNANEELYFRVRAYDADGHYDETHLDHFRLVGMEQYKQSAEADPSLLMPHDYGLSQNNVSSLGPLGGNVLVLQPPAESMTFDRGSYNVTSHFDTRKTVLKAQDRAEIDRIIGQWKGAQKIRLHVVGHTDSIRIAPEHRNEFADNKALSDARARVVAQYIADQLGLQSNQVVSEGRAATEPVASNATSAGRAKNRRVEMTIEGMRPTGSVVQSAGKTLVEPQSNTSVNINQTLEEALNLLGARTGDGATSSGSYSNAASAQSSAHALKAIYGKSHLRVQRIPVNGSRVRINGQDISGHTSLRINGDPVPLDKTGQYAVEYIMPVGSHNFDVEMVDDQGRVTGTRQVPVDVSGRHIFMVALADLTLSGNNVSGSIEPTSGDNKYDDDVLVEGRLAFYLKGKVKGKYLITAQMDSQEEELGDLFGNLFDKDPQSVLRRLDPDRYYPVYGDDSTTINDIDTQGRLYVRADWDKSRAVWGNFHTGLTSNEFAQYNRSLYGAQYQHESLAITSNGLARTEAIAFISEAQTAFGHSEFTGTGGSLYYLKHQDILPGSEKAWIEVRDRDSERVRELVTLVRGIDYEVDEIQGRIILSRPLMQVSALNAPGLIKDAPLDGNNLVLLVDYEYLPIGFSGDKATIGGSGRHWLTDTLAIGATLVDENRSGEDYSLFGGDILWQPGQGSYVKAEFAQSEASQADRFLSADGGLTFETGLVTAPGRAGDAWSIEARVNSREVMNTENEVVGGAWYRRTDDNFSVARRDTGVDTTEYGFEMTGHLSPRLDLSARASVVERELIDEDRRLSLQADYKLTDNSTVSGELRNVDEKNISTDATGLLLALRYSHKLNEAVEVYGIGQATISNDSGRYDNNDLGTVGVNLQMSDRASLQGEYSSGHRGNGALLSAEYRLDERHDVYGTFTQSVDRTDLREPGTRVALGHRSRITDQATIFNERQFIEDRGNAGIAHVFGLDFDLESGWGVGLSVQQGDLETDQGRIDRDAATVTASFRSLRINWRGKVEYRDESGASQINQVLTTNRMDLKLSQDWRLLARLNHAETEDATLTDRDDSALFTEAGVGFAYRPVANNRLNLLAKYTFLYDLPAQQQIDGGTDQRSHIVSLEGIYRLGSKWELGGKLAQRSGELRTDRDTGTWFESTTNFAAIRARYHLIRRWDAMVEVRRLDVDEAQSTRNGWLIGLDRHINDNFRVGVGYNFTDFSDDLTNLDYDHKGWFLNALGKY